MAQEAILAVKEAEQKADAIEREGEQNAEQLVQEVPCRRRRRTSVKQSARPARTQQILSRAREQAEEIQRGAEAEAGRLADALRGRADARGPSDRRSQAPAVRLIRTYRPQEKGGTPYGHYADAADSDLRAEKRTASRFWNCCRGAELLKLTNGSSRMRSLPEPIRRRPWRFLRKMRHPRRKRCACCRNMRLRKVHALLSGGEDSRIGGDVQRLL